MELVIRAGAVALCMSFAALLLRRGAPELALPLSALTVAAILLIAAGLLGGLKDLTEMVRTGFGVAELYTLPLLKCLAIAFVTKMAADLCRDAAQAAAASAVELTGTACALGVLLPLLTGALKTIGDLL